MTASLDRLQSSPGPVGQAHRARLDAMVEADEAGALIDDRSRPASRTLAAPLADVPHPHAQEEQA